MTDNIYAPPTSSLSRLHSTDSAPPLWNPNAAACWCLVFTPAFGAYLHMLNWRALGERDQELQAKSWFYASLAVLMLSVLLGALLPESKSADGLFRAIGFGFLFAWYFSAGKKQVAFVKERYGDSYVRQPWSQALLIALSCLAGFIVFAGVIGVLTGIVV